MVRFTKETYEVFEDTETEALHIKTFLEEGTLKPGHLSKGVVPIGLGSSPLSQ